MKDDVVEKFSEFLREFYYKELNEAAGEDRKSILIDFSLLEKFDPELADSLLESPQEIIKYGEDSIKEIDTGLAEKKLRLRFINLPEDSATRIRDIRAKHLGKLIVVDGIVRRAGEIRPEVTDTIFSCPACDNRISVPQTEERNNSPTECDCGYKGRLKLVDQKLIDSRWITVDEPYESSTGERPSTLLIFLNEDLTSPRMRNKTEPGNRIRVVGTLMKTPKRIKGSVSRQMEIYLEANSVEAVEVEWEELETSTEDEKKIKKLAKDPDIFEKIIGSMAPAMYGMEDVKLAIVLQLFGGEQHNLKDKTKIRGNIHVLLIGEPATGKSQLMQLVTKMMPRGKYVSGMGVSYAGFTAAAVRDEELGWQLEAGALVLANNSLCAVDEISKVAPQDLVALLQAMSIGSVSIAKAAIVATLPAQTSILAGGNPKLGRFDPFKPIREQIDIDDVLMSRFDLKFALKDEPNSDLDVKMIDHIFKMRHFNEEEAIPIIDPDLLKKYVAYAKAYCHPKLTKKAAEKIGEFYLQMRARGGEGAAVPITLRQCEALIRLAEASAKIRLSDTVSVEDAERAIRLMKVSLMQFGFDTETKQFDIDRAEGQIATAAQRGKIRKVEEMINKLAEKNGENIPIKDIIEMGNSQGIDDVGKILDKMCNEGILFRPRFDIVKKI